MPDSKPSELSPRQSTEILDGLEGLKRRARHGSGMPWLPLLLFGAFTTLTAPLVAVFGMTVLGPTWTAGGVVGFVALVPFYRRRGSRVGIGWRPELVVAGTAIFVACFAVAAIGGRAHDYAGPLLGPPLVVLVAYLFFGWYLRSVAVALSMVPGAAATGVLFALGAPPALVLLAFGLGQMLPGVYLWAREPR